MTVKIGEVLNLRYLNEFIDRQVDSIKLAESKTQRAFDLYEQKVYGACSQTDILGPWSVAKAGASPDETGPDIQIQIPGLDPAFVEVKLNLKAGMGEGSANYSPEQGSLILLFLGTNHQWSLSLLSLCFSSYMGTKRTLKTLLWHSETGDAKQVISGIPPVAVILVCSPFLSPRPTKLMRTQLGQVSIAKRQNNLKSWRRRDAA